MSTTARFKSTMTDWHHTCDRIRLVRASEVPPASSSTPMAISSRRTKSATNGTAVPRNPSLKRAPCVGCKSLTEHLNLHHTSLRPTRFPRLPGRRRIPERIRVPLAAHSNLFV